MAEVKVVKFKNMKKEQGCEIMSLQMCLCYLLRRKHASQAPGGQYPAKPSQS